MPYSSSANDVFSKVSTSQQDGSNGSICEKYLYGEHPSKTLFVKKKKKNINSNVEDSFQMSSLKWVVHVF
jgi:hypothetical protein